MYSWVKDGEAERLMTLDELRGKMGEEDWLDSTLDFFRGLRANEEERYRWDRLVALHLILLAFIEDFGHDFERPNKKTIQNVANRFENPEVPQTLREWLPKFGFSVADERRRLRDWLQKVRPADQSGIKTVANALKPKSKD